MSKYGGGLAEQAANTLKGRTAAIDAALSKASKPKAKRKASRKPKVDKLGKNNAKRHNY